jgi:hypothetical protein
LLSGLVEVRFLPMSVSVLLRWLTFCAAWLLGSVGALGHAQETNLYLKIELKPDRLVYELDVGTFQFPPLEHVKFAKTDNRPTLEQCREELEKYLRENCPVEIDGIEVQPELVRLEFEDFEAAEHLLKPLDICYAGIEYHYSIKRAPKRIGMKWGFFTKPREDDGGEFPETVAPEDVIEGVTHDPREIVADLIVDGEYDIAYFSPTEPEYIWHRKAIEKPIDTATKNRTSVQYSGISNGLNLVLMVVATCLAIFAVGAAVRKKTAPAIFLTVATLGSFGAAFALRQPTAKPLSDEEAIELFGSLQANIYAAFDHNTEDEIYDALSQSVAGELLDQVYNDVYEGLILREEGGVMARVQKVETEKVGIVSRPGEGSDSYRFGCIWQVHGFVKHYSHTHRRVNRYNVTYEMAPRSGEWKIVHSIENEKRERLDGQAPGTGAGGVLPPPTGGAALEDDLGDFGQEIPANPDNILDIDQAAEEEDLNLPGVFSEEGQ